MQTNTDTLGAYVFNGLETPGIYKLKVVPGEGSENIEESVILENKGNTIQCKYVDVQLPSTYSGTVKPEEETQVEIKTSYKSVTKVSLTFPSGSVDAETGISIVQLPFVNVPVKRNEEVTDAESVPPFFIVKILPTGAVQELKQPMQLTIGTIIKNSTYLKWLYLYKLENNEWKRQDVEVSFNSKENRYEVSLSSFGTYCLLYTSPSPRDCD